jgi:hypothetical protein
MTTPSNGTQDAGQDSAGHPLPGARLAEEMRLLLDALAERAQPLLNRLAAAPTGEQGEHNPATCGWCPLCAGIAVLRGDRPELAVRAAEHASGLLAVLRDALAQRPQAAPEGPADESAPPAPATPPADEPANDRVQHIQVRRRGADGVGEC